MASISLPERRTGRVRHMNKVALTVGLVGLTVAAIGGAALATFTSTTNVSQPVASGTVAFAPIATSAAGQRLSVAATDIAPGDTIQRAVTLTNTGSVDMLPGSVNLTTTGHDVITARHRVQRTDDDDRQVLGAVDRIRRRRTPTRVRGPRPPRWQAGR